MNGDGLKYDAGKQPWYAMPLVVLKPLADVFAAGEKKYKIFNCLQPFVDSNRRFYDGQMRHKEACQLDPLAIDEETGCYHAAQEAFNALMRLHHALKEQKAQPVPDCSTCGKSCMVACDEIINDRLARIDDGLTGQGR